MRAAVLVAPAFSPHVKHDSLPRRPSDLPLVEVTAAGGTSRLLAVLLTGDGGWADFDRRLASAFASHGVAVVGLNSRTYLTTRRTPEEAAADVERVLRYYRAAWHRDRVLLVGYSRGADMAPFVANRIADSLREGIAVVALIGPAEQANFQFHWVDLVRDTARPTDVPVRPELEGMRDMTVLCVYGRAEVTSLCPNADSSTVHLQPHDGGHGFKGSIERLATDIIALAKR